MIPEYQTTLLSTETVARDTQKFRFSKPDNWTFQSGQFLSLKFGEKAWRAYSIASTPDETEIELLIRLIPGGVGSEALKAANIGDEFTFRGGFGHFVLSETPDAELIFCCTGTGIAPFRAMIKEESAKKNPRKISLYYGGRDAEDIGYLDEINTWGTVETHLGLSRAEKNCHIEGTNAQNCRITEFLENTDFSKKSAEFYICGNGDMVVSVREILEKKEIPKEHIFQERFN